MSPVSHSVSSFQLSPRLPGDKSITHRAYLLGALAAGETRVEGGNTGEDCRSTLLALDALGVFRTAADDAVVIQGRGGAFSAPENPLDLGNSGTGMRLLLGILAAMDITVVLTGDASLERRPMERVLAPLREMGATATAVDGHAPITLRGGTLRGICHRMSVPSAQVKSALLLAGLQARGRTRVEGGAGSRDHTERLLLDFGAEVEVEEDAVAVVGPQRLQGTTLRVPRDPSAAAFFAVAAALVPGSQVICEEVGLNPTRTGSFDALARMGLDVSCQEEASSGAEPRGRVAFRHAPLRGRVFLETEIPGLIDELPVLAVAAAFAEGETVVQGAGELRFKESDRLRTVADGLAAIGASVSLREDGWIITGSGGRELPGGRVVSGGDHRIAMAFLIAGLRCRNGVEIVDASGIETSDPGFLPNLNRVLAS